MLSTSIERLFKLLSQVTAFGNLKAGEDVKGLLDMPCVESFHFSIPVVASMTSQFTTFRVNAGNLGKKFEDNQFEKAS